MAAPVAPASPLLDFKQPFDVPLLDTTIKAFYGAGSNQEVCRLSASQLRRLPLQDICECQSCRCSSMSTWADNPVALCFVSKSCGCLSSDCTDLHVLV